MGRSNVAAESIVQRRGALDEVAAIALIFSDGIFVLTVTLFPCAEVVTVTEDVC